MTTEIAIVRQDAEVTPADLETFRRVLYALTGGLTRLHDQRWKRFWNWIVKAEPGEMLTWFQNRARSGPFHRRHMKMEASMFESQERFDDFETFRSWSKIGAGYVVWAPGGAGMPAIVAVPKSIAYSSLDEDGMQDLHAAMVAFWRTDRASRALWPHLKTPAARIEMVERILMGFGE
jgi:hypothetical protein